jgi:signal transduction histidine kinase/DNA-binding response OmpR family regulator/uncharacterized protein (DUF433 family)
MANNRIVRSSKIANGVPVIRETQVPVHGILDQLAAGANLRKAVDQLTGLELADVKAALEYASSLVRQQRAKGTEPLDVKTVSSEGSVELNMRKILIVDDLEDNRILMKHMFKGSGFTLITATDGEEAFKKARAELPVLVISDIQMPGTSGLDLLTTLKSDKRTKHMGVILVTAHARGPGQTSQGLDMGADDYLSRPFTKAEFLSRVGSIMRLKWSEEQTRRKAQAVAQHNTGLELVNELALAVNSSLDLQEIFAASMLRLSELLEAEIVSVLLLNESKQQLEVNISSHLGRRVSALADFAFETKVTAQEIKDEVPAIVANVLTDSYNDLGLDSVPRADTIQCIPMISKEQVIGAIAISNKQSGSFADTDWILLHSAAGIIAVAVENVRLLEAAHDQLDDLIVLNEIGRALTSSLDQDQILKQTTLLVQRSLQAEAASLWLLDETDQELELIAASGIGAARVTGYRLSVTQGLAGYVARTGEPYSSADVSRDEKYFGLVTDELGDYTPHSILSVPVRIKGQIIGVMQALHRNIGWFGEKDMRFFHSVASSVGIAVENAQLFGEVQSFNRHLEQMVAERTKELAEEKEKTEAILASMADGLLVLDAQNHILTANLVAEEMLDFDLSQMEGQPIGPEQLDSPMWSRINVMANSTKLTDSALVDMLAVQTNMLRSIQARSAKVHNETDEIIGTVIVLRDITALKEVERMKARFTAGITHELRTPLAIIRLHTKNLLKYDERLSAQMRSELLNSIQSQVELLTKLIEDILHLSRLDNGIVETQLEPLDLGALVAQLLVELRPLAQAKQIALNYTKSTKRPFVQVNPEHLERVIRNLIENAIKYTPSDGSIQVQTVSELRDNQEFVGVQVADNGIGIPPEYHSQIFDRFYRVDPSHTIPGTGLGLSIVKEIISAYGGDVHLESKPGVGSTFVVAIPRVSGKVAA